MPDRENSGLSPTTLYIAARFSRFASSVALARDGDTNVPALKAYRVPADCSAQCKLGYHSNAPYFHLVANKC